MNKQLQPIIFGEVLFDCFPDGAQVLGGAPFNVAWHMQALGLAPLMISRVGDDPLARQIRASMQSWGMSCAGLQMDSRHPTGVVQVSIEQGEPHYDIVADRAYDFIDADALPPLPQGGLIYHGSLALRNPVSRQALQKIKALHNATVFMDVNLRSPWWNREEILQWIGEANWVKLNHDELQQLGLAGDNIADAATRCIQQFDLDGMVVTSGEAGALAVNKQGQKSSITPEPVDEVIDTVGAGDAFTSVVLTGLIQQWPMQQTMERAQRLASRIVGIRGALPSDQEFYQHITG